MGLAHEVRGPDEEPSPIWRLSDVDPNSLMHPLYDAEKYITKTDCRLFKFYYENFKDIRCDESMIGSETGVAEMIQDVADPNCLGSDPNKYILNQPYRDKGIDTGYTRRGFLLTQCLGVQDERYPDYMYVLQSDGNFVSYNIKTKKAIWSTQSQGLGAKGSYSMFFQVDGNLVIYDAKGTPTWASGSWHGSSANFRIEPFYWYFKEGHMYLSDASGRFAWATRTVLAHTNQRIEAKDVNGGHTDYCLDYSSKLYKCAGGNDQEFNIYTDGTIRSAKSDYCLYASRAENE
ncbi:hypothetical protein BGZ47_000171 [Haplosporangium gracile]|nr:hypothetical protein BGZ47_000171 [Haplosporangium gracile]